MVLYAIGLFLFRIWVGILSLFNRKVRAGISGRKNLIASIRAHYSETSREGKRILIHVSSYGELEQAKPIIEGLRTEFPDGHIHLTFFSPSGYLNTAGKYSVPDLITYLPFDSKANVRRFLDSTRPDVVLFARYDVWHNLARELKKRNIPSVLFSATFSDTWVKRLPVVKRIQRETYNALSRIFCISESDRDAFLAYGVKEEKVVTAGDTRYDQVAQRKTKADEMPVGLSGSLHERLIDRETFVLVAGSTWPPDEALIKAAWESIDEKNANVLLVLAPHEVTEEHLVALEYQFAPTTRLSFYNGAHIILVDSIGKLFDLYRYAHVAYVGGGFGAGVHNVLEPAVWGVPVIVGPKHGRSQEVAKLIAGGGAFEVRSSEALTPLLQQYIADHESRKIAGNAAREFVEKGRGARGLILTFVRKLAILHTPS